MSIVIEYIKNKVIISIHTQNNKQQRLTIIVVCIRQWVEQGTLSKRHTTWLLTTLTRVECERRQQFVSSLKEHLLVKQNENREMRLRHGAPGSMY